MQALDTGQLTAFCVAWLICPLDVAMIQSPPLDLGEPCQFLTSDWLAALPNCVYPHCPGHTQVHHQYLAWLVSSNGKDVPKSMLLTGDNGAVRTRIYSFIIDLT